MTHSTTDLHPLTLGSARYWLRTPTPYDLPKMRRVLARQGVRRPSANELRVAALAGIEQMAALTGAAAEGEAQQDIVTRWYELLAPIDENDVDEPDGEKRAAIVAEREAERQAGIGAIAADVLAIQANLERHHPPYRELVADQDYWDDVSRIDAVRLLLVKSDSATFARDDQDMVASAAYLALPDGDRFALATFAFTLLAPAETQRKN